MKNQKPEAHTRCIRCGEPIGCEEYTWAKNRGAPPVFMHMRCYEELLPKQRKIKALEGRA